MPTVNYTTPLLCSWKDDLSKAWFIYFDITHPSTGEIHRKQFRGGINYYRTVQERTGAGKALMKVWRDRLKAGWNPWGIEPDAIVTELDKITFNKAMDFALSKCKASESTKRAYGTCVRYIKRAAMALHLDQLPASEIKRRHIMLMLEYCTAELGWTNAAHNKNLGFLHAVLGKLIRWEVLEYNPSDKIDPLPVVETQKFIPYTPEEKQRIQEHLFVHHYPFYVYLMVIYHTGMRPKEVLALQIIDIDLHTGIIKILPDLEEENSKTKSIRRIPINPHLAPFLRELQLETFDPAFYIFGSPAGPNGNRGRGSDDGNVTGASRTDYFRPHPTRIKRDTATKLWKKIVMDQLGINKYQYAMKHTGGDDKILAGMDLDALRELYGHHSKFMTEKYASKIKEVRREHIMQHSPGFLQAPANKKAP